jgi:hypothetical protein
MIVKVGAAPAILDYQSEVRSFLNAIAPKAKDWLFLTYDDHKGSEKAKA